MNYLNKIKLFSSGCVAGVLLQLCMYSAAEKRFQIRKDEVNMLKLLCKNKIENLKNSSPVLGEQDLIVSFIYHSYVEYLLNAGFNGVNYIVKEIL